MSCLRCIIEIVTLLSTTCSEDMNKEVLYRVFTLNVWRLYIPPLEESVL